VLLPADATAKQVDWLHLRLYRSEMADDQSRLRATFDAVAELYDRARPGYPDALFDDVVALSGIPPGGRLLEIGCGTGQATLPFARRGFRIECVELGAGLAAVARRNLAAFPQVAVHVGAFETWPVEAGAFDLAIAATAFHWIDPAVRYAKVARALRPPADGRAGGAIALFWNHHIKSAADQDFFDNVQVVYERAAPEKAKKWVRLPLAEEMGTPEKQRIEESGLFGAVTVRTYRWDQVYDAASYVDVLNTYSDHRDQPAEERERLFQGIAEMIDSQYSGRVTKGYLTILYVAHRK
jgi:SAM-dependent methyltransferase